MKSVYTNLFVHLIIQDGYATLTGRTMTDGWRDERTEDRRRLDGRRHGLDGQRTDDVDGTDDGTDGQRMTTPTGRPTGRTDG